MTTLGDLTKLLEQGFLTGEYTHTSPDGNYKFEFKTITPLEEIEASKHALAQAKGGDENEQKVHTAIETLARCITKVNGVELEKMPGAEGTTNLDKKRSIIKRLSDKLLINIWNKYQDIRSGTLLDGSPQEADAIKK